MNWNKAAFFMGAGFLAASIVGIYGCTQVNSRGKSTAADRGYKGKYDIQTVLKHPNSFPIVIIGSGPAGLASGIYGARGNMKTLVLEGDLPGGLLTQTTHVENWPGDKNILGNDIINQLRDQAKHFGAQIANETVARIDFNVWPFEIYTDNDRLIRALTIIVATGASPRKLGIPGEEEYWGKGVTSCAVCDAPFFKGKEVVVVGGGDSAIEEAMQLSGYAKKITILVRKESMRAAPHSQQLIKAYENVSIIYNVDVKEVRGDGDKMIEIELYNNKDNSSSIFKTEGLFLAIGHIPNTDIVKDVVELDELGFIALKDRSQATNVPGVYAAGDVEDHRYRQAGVASGSGIKAALDALAFLNDLGLSAEVAEKMHPKIVEIDESGEEKESSDSLVELSDVAQFDELVKNSGKKLVIVDFYTQSCVSCKRMLPDLQEVASDNEEFAVFVKVDAEELEPLADRYHISKVPTIIALQNGKLVARYNQALSKKELKEMLEKLKPE